MLAPAVSAAPAGGAHAWIAPGCTLLRVEPVLPAPPGAQAQQAAALPGAAAVAAALLSGPGAAWWRAHTFDVAVSHAPAVVACYSHATGLAEMNAAAAAAEHGHNAAPSMLLPSVRALCTASPSSFWLRDAAALVPGGAVSAPAPPALRCRMRGAFVGLAPAPPLPPRHEGMPQQLAGAALPACGLEGATLFETVRTGAHAHGNCSASDGAHCASFFAAPAASPATAVLLTPCAATAAEVVSLASDGTSEDDADACVRAIGAALADEHCPVGLRAAAAAEAARRGWAATLVRIMTRAVVDGADVEEDAEQWRCPDGSGLTLLHAAASSGSAATVRALLALRAPAICGSPASMAGAGALTPCHIAAASALADEASADAIASLLRAAPGGAAAWSHAAAATGTTPAQLRALCGAEVTRREAHAMLPALRVLAVCLAMFCILEYILVAWRLRPQYGLPPVVSAATMSAALAPGSSWAQMRPLMLGLRPVARAPIAAAALAAAYAPRATALFCARPRPLVLLLAAHFGLWECMNGAWGASQAAAAFISVGHDAALSQHTLLRWPPLVGALQLLLTAACHALPLRPARLQAAVMALRVLLLPLAAELFGARCWPALHAPMTWHGAHVALAAALLLTQRARLRRDAAAARVAALTGAAAPAAATMSRRDVDDDAGAVRRGKKFC
jgi:hypothetical protein